MPQLHEGMMAFCPGQARQRWLEGVSFNRGILDCLPIAACLYDRSGQIMAWNRAAVRLWGGAPVEDEGGRHIGAHKLLRPDGSDPGWAKTPLAGAMEAGLAVSSAEMLLERADGSRARCLLTIAPLGTGRGEVAGAMICFQALDGPDPVTPPAEGGDQAHQELPERVRDSERRLHALVNGVRDCAIVMLDPEGMIADWNIGAERLKGYAESEIVGRHFSVFYSDDDRGWGAPQRALTIARTAGRFEAEGWQHRRDSSRFWAHIVIESIRDGAGKHIFYANVTRDLTEKRDIEDQLRQARKLEAIGHLTGGIAHDFNNLLAVVVGNLEALKRRFEGSHGEQERLFLRLTDGALQGADRAAALTRQLLAFSRRRTLDPEPLEPAGLIASMLDVLRRLLGERITVEASLAAEIWPVFADAHQLESTLLTLAVNARNAMPTGGRLSISAANLRVAAATPFRDLPPGDYVVISVADTGNGRSPSAAPQNSIRDSGPGLAQLYDFARQSGGMASLESASGAGTIVHLHLPRCHDLMAPAAPGETDPAVPPAQPAALILLVEDDDLVRGCNLEILRDLGYRAVAARDGHEALRLLEAHREIGLVFTDLGLPGDMDGEQLATQIRLLRPDMKFLFTTGYVDADTRSRNDPAGRTAILAKPFHFARLGEQLRLLLDAGAPP